MRLFALCAGALQRLAGTKVHGKTWRELERNYTETADSCFKPSILRYHIPKHDTVIENLLSQDKLKAAWM